MNNFKFRKKGGCFQASIQFAPNWTLVLLHYSLDELADFKEKFCVAAESETASISCKMFAGCSHIFSPKRKKKRKKDSSILYSNQNALRSVCVHAHLTCLRFWLVGWFVKVFVGLVCLFSWRKKGNGET